MAAAALAKAIADGQLAQVPQAAYELVASDDALFPLSVVEWQVASTAHSRIVLDKTFRASERLPFFAGRLAHAVRILEGAHATGELTPGSLLINLDDGAVERGIAFCSRHPNDILVPDTVFISTRGQSRLRDLWSRRALSWKRRLPTVFWRGNTTGRWIRDWRDLPRLAMCRLAQARPDVFDAGISKVVQIPPEAEAEIRREGLFRPFIPEEMLDFYQYHIDIDGNTNAWSGLFLKLLSGSPVLKVRSCLGFTQWYDDRLREWENYVPVEPEMTDLMEKVEWLKGHDDAAERIGLAGRALAESMTFEAEMAQSANRLATALRSKLTEAPKLTLAAAIMHKLYGGNMYSDVGVDMPEDLQGWNSRHPVLAKIVADKRPSIIVDVGVWKGASTLFFAELLNLNGTDGAVIAIDTFLGSPEHWSTGGQMSDLIERKWGRPLLYEQFLSNVIRRGATERVVPLPQTSTNAAVILRRLGVQIDLVHIDASQEYESVMQDAQAFWPLLRPGGVLVGDDYHESWPGVVRAAEELARTLNRKLEIAPPKWILRKE